MQAKITELPRGSRDFSLSCVVPVFNEGAGIARFLEELHQCAAQITSRLELVVVNDGSTDDSAAQILQCAERFQVHYLELSRNFGKECALQAGLDAAEGDCVCILDADFQHPAKLIPSMVRRWQAGIDMVYAVCDRADRESWPRRLARATVNRLLSSQTQLHIPIGAGDFRVLDRKVVQVLCSLPERTRFMKGLYAWSGFKTEAIPYEPEQRRSGTSKYGVTKLAGLAITGITAFSTAPLRLVSLLGLTIALAAVLSGAWIVFERLFMNQPIPGFATLAASILLLSGVQLLSLGIVGEYVGRIFNEVKRRPLYVVARRRKRGALSQSVRQRNRA